MTISDIWVQQLRALRFQKVQFESSVNKWPLYIYLIVVAWIVGIGRYWDHPDAHIWQYLGFGSVAYIFVLSTFLYVVVKPLAPPRWSYSLVFTFVGFTSLPALLYAIPVEKLLLLEHANILNAWFLGVVAVWRVALYVSFLRRGAGLGKFEVFVATLLPLSTIIASLAFLNLEHVVFELMSGMRGVKSAGELSYSVVFVLSVFSYLMLPITLVCYWYAIDKRKRRQVI